MSLNPNPQGSMQPLSVGNVVSAGLVLYRSHLKWYLTIALRATGWAILPFFALIPVPFIFIANPRNYNSLLIIIPVFIGLYIYCLAKSLVNSALISRLAFSELVNKPETEEIAIGYLNPKMWRFLSLTILTALIFIGVFIVLYILLAIVGAILAGILIGLGTATGQQGSGAIVAILAGGAIGLLLFIGLIWVVVWLYSRLLIAELPLTIENNLKASESISRSWQLTKGFVWRIQGIVMIAFLISLPIQVVVQLFSSILQGLFENLIRQEPSYAILYGIAIIALSLLSSALIVPFWQAIKAVLYYDLRTRREGLDLQAGDRRFGI
ncbi:MAG TPA: glycerophosphoryl diester phosphodiesterase membrane domain-containing protein [Leptolyngbyaceae cyanobacterium]